MDLKEITRNSLAEDSRSIRLERGQIVFVHSNLGTFAKVKGNPLEVLTDSFLDVLGETVTLVVPGNTTGTVFWKTHIVASVQSKTYTSALPNFLLKGMTLVDRNSPLTL